MGASESVTLPPEEVRSICRSTGRKRASSVYPRAKWTCRLFRLHSERTATTIRSLSRIRQTKGFWWTPLTWGSVECPGSCIEPAGRTSRRRYYPRLRSVGRIVIDRTFPVFFVLGERNKISFEQFAQVLARFRRGKGHSDISTRENKLRFLFSVRILRSRHWTTLSLSLSSLSFTTGIMIRRLIATRCWKCWSYWSVHRFSSRLRPIICITRSEEISLRIR